MADGRSLESKLLDGKNAGYCSSSDDEEEEGGFKRVDNDDDEHQARVMKKVGGNQTGAKGVKALYKEHLEMNALEAREANRANVERAKRGMISSSAEEREKAEREEMGEATLEELREMRLAEMRKVAQGRIVELPGKNELLSSIIDTSDRLLFVLLYEDGNDRTAWATKLTRLLASNFPHLRVCRIKASLAGMSDRFIAGGVPTLQVYYGGELTLNLVPLQLHIGEDAEIDKLISLLRKNNVNLDKNRMYDGESESEDE